MKKVITILAMMVTVIFANAQEHLTFLGVPIDGTVNEFADKLKAKGARVSPKNQYASKGLRVMEGKFLGETEEFGLHYDTDTKKMYSIALVKSFETVEAGKEYCKKVKDLLEEKYPDAKYKSNSASEERPVSCSYQMNFGIITLVIKDAYPFYRFTLTYCDRINYMPVYKKQHQRNLDDI